MGLCNCAFRFVRLITPREYRRKPILIDLQRENVNEKIMNHSEKKKYLMIFSYSLSFPFESFHRRNMTEASTLAGLKVLGSFNKLTTDNKIVLKQHFY